MTPTHKRRARLAECVQFDGVTIPEGLPCSIDLHNGALMLRNEYKNLIGTLHRMDWAVIGEDGRMRIYSDEKFQLMYEAMI